jgi:hypothetical protein
MQSEHVQLLVICGTNYFMMSEAYTMNMWCLWCDVCQNISNYKFLIFMHNKNVDHLVDKGTDGLLILNFILCM